MPTEIKEEATVTDIPLHEHSHEEDPLVPIKVVALIEVLRSSARRDRLLIIFLVGAVLLALFIESALLISISNRADQVVKSNKAQADALIHLKQLQDEAAITEDLIRQLIVCGRDSECQRQIVNQIEAQEARIAAEKGTGAPGSASNGSSGSTTPTTRSSAPGPSPSTTTTTASTTTTTTTQPQRPLTPVITAICQQTKVC